MEISDFLSCFTNLLLYLLQSVRSYLSQNAMSDPSVTISDTSEVSPDENVFLDEIELDEEKVHHEEKQDLKESSLNATNAFTGQSLSKWYCRVSQHSNPGAFYWVNRETGEAQYACPPELLQTKRTRPALQGDVPSTVITKDEKFKVPVRLLSSIDISHYSGSANDVSDAAKHVLSLWVIGGVHGNEVFGIKGVQLLNNFLKQPRFSLTRLLLERAHVAVIPCINRVGNMAMARCAPVEGVDVTMQGDRVLVADDEHGGGMCTLTLKKLNDLKTFHTYLYIISIGYIYMYLCRYVCMH